jgi:hypothetical protein
MKVSDTLLGSKILESSSIGGAGSAVGVGLPLAGLCLLKTFGKKKAVTITAIVMVTESSDSTKGNLLLTIGLDLLHASSRPF